MSVTIHMPPPAESEMEKLEQKHVIVTAWLANVREEIAHCLNPPRLLILGEQNLRRVLAEIESGLRAWN